MDSQARKIPEQEWERYSNTILHLYHDCQLPLHSEKDERSVQNIMRDVHQFDASVSQFEAFFRRHGRPKNLKREEWRAVHAKLAELANANFETRVRISGQVLSKERLDRSKRYVLSKTRQSHSSRTSLELPSSNRVTIEFRIPDGEWITYSDQNADAGSHCDSSTATDQSIYRGEPTSQLQLNFGKRSTPQAINPTGASQARRYSRESLTAFTLQSSSRGVISRRQSPIAMSRERQSSFPYSPWNSPLHLVDIDPFAEPDSVWIRESSQFQGALFDTPLLSSSWAPIPPGFLGETWPHPTLHEPPLDSSTRIYSTLAISENNKVQDHGMDATLWNSAARSIQPFVQSLILETAQMSAYDSSTPSYQRRTGLPRVDEVLDDLLYSMPESLVKGESGQWSKLSSTSNTPDFILFNALLSSIANGFAGLDKVPVGAVFRVLRQQTHMSSRLFDCLRLSPLPVARALADNLFRASVEACDEQAVRSILQQTQHYPIAIDPNDITCRLPGGNRLYTPIEVAARSRHFGIVQVLLAAGANIDKSYGSETGFDECGALEHAIRKWGDNKPVELKLVRMLLNHHPVVRPPIVLAAIRWGQEDIIRELIARLQPPSHSAWFMGPGPFSSNIEDALQHLENKLALLLVRKALDDCQNEPCLKCIRERQNILETLLWKATKTGNPKLAKLLMPHITNKTMALTAAVKTGDRKLIDLAFELGAIVSGDSCRLYEFDSGAVQITSDKETVRSYSFNNKYLELGRLRRMFTITPLSEAVRLQNKDLIHEFESLEISPPMHNCYQEHWGAVLTAAAQVGDLNYLQSLLRRMPNQVGNELSNALLAAVTEDEMDAAWILMDNYAAMSSEPLRVLLEKQNELFVDRFLETRHQLYFPAWLLPPAVKWGNIPLLEYFLEPLVTNFDASTWLQEAVIANNSDVIMLIFKKFDFISSAPDAILDLEWAFNIFLQNHSIRYPHGSKGFAGNLLVRAIHKQNTALVKILLAEKADMNSGLRQVPSKLVVDIMYSRGYYIPHGFVTAFGYAIQFEGGTHVDLVEQLINAGGDLRGLVINSGNHETPDLLVSVQRTALLLAIETSSEKMVVLLLKNGADPHQVARRGLRRTPLQQACEVGNVNIVNILLEKGVDVNEPPALDSGATSLQLASMSGNIRIAKLLLARGANVHAPKARVLGKTALEGAAENGRMHMIELLRGATNGQGFSREEIDNSTRLAKHNGHHGCAQYITSVFGGAASNSSLLEGNLFTGSEDLEVVARPCLRSDT